jgi:hypothetical protein
MLSNRGYGDLVPSSLDVFVTCRKHTSGEGYVQPHGKPIIDLEWTAPSGKLDCVCTGVRDIHFRRTSCNEPNVAGAGMKFPSRSRSCATILSNSQI